MTAFSKGDKVRSTTNHQGLVRNQVYEVTDIDERHTAFGNFVSYQLDGRLWIGNGHLLLQPAS